jgi:hypothetical protein
MVKLSDESKQDMQGSDLIDGKPSKAQALAQTKDKSKTKAKGNSKTKAKTSTLSQKKKKKDLLNRIDSQLAKLKGGSEKKEKKEEEGDDEYKMDFNTGVGHNSEHMTDGSEKEAKEDVDVPDVKSDEVLDHLDQKVAQQGQHRYMDSDLDEYAINGDEVHRKLDGGRYSKHSGDLDLYDMFKDFDRDGDGIVDDIDLDDPHWKESCNKNGWDPLDYDDNTFRQGRYRGLTDEQWS